MNVRNYIDRINNAYREHRNSYNELAAKYDDINSKIENLKNHRSEYSAAGFKERIDKYEKEQRGIRNELEKLDKSFRTAAAEVRKECADRFSRRYMMNKDSIDRNALDLIQSGVLMADELRAMAEDYADNNTMLRFIGHAMHNTDNNELQKEGSFLIRKSGSRPHLDVVDGFTEDCAKGLRADSASNGYTFGEVRAMADGYDSQLHEGFYNQYASEGEAISDGE